MTPTKSNSDPSSGSQAPFHEKETGENYLSLFNTVSDAVITSDLEDRIMSWNRSAEKIFGRKSQDVIGKNLSQLTVPFELWDEREAVLRHVKSGSMTAGIDTQRLRGDETLINVSMTTSPVRDANFNIVGVLYVFKDLDESMRMREELKEGEEKFHSVVQSKTDAVILSDSIGKIISWNRGAQKIFQYSEEEVLGKPLTILIPERFRIPHENGLKWMISTGESHIIGKTVKLYGLRKDRSEFPIDLTLSKWRKGKTSFYSGIIRDITQRKKAEEILFDIECRKRLSDIGSNANYITDRKKAEEISLENMRLTLAGKAESEFLAGISHEFRTPLNSIIGFAELLKQKMQGDLNKKQEQYVGNVLTSGKYLLNLVDNLELKMVEADKIQLVIEKVSVPEVINEIILLVKEKAVKQNVTLKKDIDPQLDFIEADKRRLRQMLFNLASNAIKFSKAKGGTVTITAKKAGGLAKFQVIDTGIGIEEKKLAVLFDQHADAGKGKNEGSGLGLIISKKLVESHGGTITAESKYGAGSTFTFQLPLIAKV
ncbi:Methyl sulfide methyltransferase-associated sensor [uncultured archaeon]|nr:Methyl sulfide methyltransferase-associated sensor [uncultured archaeon]